MQTSIFSGLRKIGSRRKRQAAALALSRVIGPKRDVPRVAVARVLEACRNLGDGEVCGPEVYTLLQAAMNERRSAAGIGDAPDNPVVTGLRAVRSGLPDWWLENGNLMLAGERLDFSRLARALGMNPPPSNSLIVLGEDVFLKELTLTGDGALCVIGDEAQLRKVVVSAFDGALVLIGNRTLATGHANVSAKNGGALVTGCDGLWADPIRIMTDDFHAIRDRETNARINKFGGRIVVDRHVWLSMGVVLMGDCHVGEDCVLGHGANLKDAALPPGTVSVGSPARVVRRGIVWALDDLP